MRGRTSWCVSILPPECDGVRSGNGSVGITYVQPADLTLAKSCGRGPAAPGGTASCTLTVSNAAPGTAVDISLTDDLATGLTLVGTPAGGGFACGTGDPFTCTLASVAPGATAHAGDGNGGDTR